MMGRAMLCQRMGNPKSLPRRVHTKATLEVEPAGTGLEAMIPSLDTYAVNTYSIHLTPYFFIEK